MAALTIAVAQQSNLVCFPAQLSTDTVYAAYHGQALSQALMINVTAQQGKCT